MGPPAGGHGPRRLLTRESRFVQNARVRPEAISGAGRARPPEAPRSFSPRQNRTPTKAPVLRKSLILRYRALTYGRTPPMAPKPAPAFTSQPHSLS